MNSTELNGLSFDAQLARAKAEQHFRAGGITPAEGMWDSRSSLLPKYPTGMDSLDAIQNHLKDPNFATFVKAAYDAPEGYSIRINPATGKKEMMVAGTRDANQWVLNAVDSGLYLGDKAIKTLGNAAVTAAYDAAEEIFPLAHVFPKPHIKGVHLLERADPWRQTKQKYYAQIAKENGVDLVYGHSRGGALVADMSLPRGVQKVGLDAAMLIAHNTGMLNINEGGGLNPLGLFDEAIGLTGKENVTFDASTFSPHKVWATTGGNN